MWGLPWFGLGGQIFRTFTIFSGEWDELCFLLVKQGETLPVFLWCVFGLSYLLITCLSYCLLFWGWASLQFCLGCCFVLCFRCIPFVKLKGNSASFCFCVVWLVRLAHNLVCFCLCWLLSGWVGLHCALVGGGWFSPCAFSLTKQGKCCRFLACVCLACPTCS